MINSIGLPNKGLDGFVEHDLPELARLPVPLCVSVMATDRDGFARLVEAVGGREEVAAIELNVSCPNVKSGLIVGEQPAETVALCEHLRPLTPKPLIVKLTPNTADPAAVAAAAEEGGADAVSLINTLKASALDPATMRPWLGAGSGGLSGPAVRAVALDQVRRVAAAVSIPLIGMGGIESGEDALAFLASGAAAIAVGTASFRDPAAASRIRAELAAELEVRGLPTLPRARADVDLNLRSKRISPKKAASPLFLAPAGLYSPPPMAPASVDTTSAAVPERSREQRMKALRRANEIRSARAQLKRDLKGGKVKIEKLLLDPPDYVLSAKAFDMILAVPKYGRVKANKILTQCRISPSKTIGGLSARQRGELVQYLRR